MNHLHNAIKKLNIHPFSYKKIKNVYLVNDEYIIKLNTNKYDIYKYLVSKSFLSVPKFYNDSNDNYDILEYIKEYKMDKVQKINDYLKILSILHFKTSYKREIDLDEIKKNYEELINRIHYLRKYYYELNDVIDKEIFLSPSYYLLVRNISMIYSVLNICEDKLNKIYNKLKNTKSIRICLLHNNISLDHLLLNDKEYLISWDKSYFDNPIIELENFYKKYYEFITINDFFKIYETVNKLTTIEKELLLVKLAIPSEIKFTNNNLEDSEKVNKEINYLKNIYDILISFKE